MSAAEEPVYSTTIMLPWAFDQLASRRCLHSDGPAGSPTCVRDALYRAELDGAHGPHGTRVVTAWCAEHAALWRATPDVPVRLISTLVWP